MTGNDGDRGRSGLGRMLDDVIEIALGMDHRRIKGPPPALEPPERAEQAETETRR